MLRLTCGGIPLMLLSFFILGCVDQIDLSQGDPLDDGISLSGRMWVQGTNATVVFRGGRLFRFNSNRSERLINAEVTVELTNGTTHSLDYDIDRDVFEASFTLPRAQQAGLEARIRVITIEQEEYLSAWDPLPEELPSGTLTPRQDFDADGNPTKINYSLSTPARRADGSGIPFLYRFSRTYRVLGVVEPSRYCYFTDSLRQVEYTLVEPRSDFTGNLRTIEIYQDEVDWRYAEGHYFNVTQDPISDTAFEYFSNFVSFADRDRSIFEAPPGNLPGNFQSVSDPEQARIYGLFYVTRPQIIRSGIPPGEVDVDPFCSSINNQSTLRCNAQFCGQVGGGGQPGYWTF